MKFDVEITKTLRITNDCGLLAILKEGDEVYLKLDLPNMNLSDKEHYMQKYPDGWVRGIIGHISNSGRKINFELYGLRCHYLSLNQKDILDVSDKAPREELV